MKALFPLWGSNTKELAKQFILEKFKTHICSIDASKIPNELIGVDYSNSFLNELPENIDPCGENGEFHSFCYDGPIYKRPISFTKNGIINKTYTHNNQEHLYLFSDIT